MRKLKTKYIDNKQQNNKTTISIRYVYIPRLTYYPNYNNDLKLTMLGGKLFHTLMIRSLKNVSHINTTMADEQFIWVPAICGTTATRRVLYRLCPPPIEGTAFEFRFQTYIASN